MTIKKTYTCCRVGLLIWLLNFHVLSSCVSTGRGLGMVSQSKKERSTMAQLKKKNQQYAHKADVCFGKSVTNSNETCPYCKHPRYNCKKCVWSCIAGTVMLCGAVAGGYYILSNNPSESNPISSIMPNTTVPGNATAYLGTAIAPLENIVHTREGIIGNTLTTLGIGMVNTTGIIMQALKSNRSNLHNDTSSSITTHTPFRPTNLDTSTRPSKSAARSSKIEPIALTKEVIFDIRAHRFSKKRIQYWFDLGLPIDAADAEEERTLLMEAANRNDLPLVQFLCAKEANVHAIDNRGNTALMYALNLGPKAKLIVDYLEEYGSTPCRKNVDGRPWNADIEKFDNVKLLNKFKQCS